MKVLPGPGRDAARPASAPPGPLRGFPARGARGSAWGADRGAQPAARCRVEADAPAAPPRSARLRCMGVGSHAPLHLAHPGSARCVSGRTRARWPGGEVLRRALWFFHPFSGILCGTPPQSLEPPGRGASGELERTSPQLTPTPVPQEPALLQVPSCEHLAAVSARPAARCWARSCPPARLAHLRPPVRRSLSLPPLARSALRGSPASQTPAGPSENSCPQGGFAACLPIVRKGWPGDLGVAGRPARPAVLQRWRAQRLARQLFASKRLHKNIVQFQGPLFAPTPLFSTEPVFFFSPPARNFVLILC